MGCRSREGGGSAGLAFGFAIRAAEVVDLLATLLPLLRLYARGMVGIDHRLTLLTKGFITLGTHSKAGKAGVVVAMCTRCDTFREAVAVTARAPNRTVAADIGFTPFATGTVVVVHHASAVAAINAVPVVETHVGAAWVVSVENLPHEREEVEQPSLPQCLTDGHVAIAFAKFAGLHVRMRLAQPPQRGRKVPAPPELPSHFDQRSAAS